MDSGDEEFNAIVNELLVQVFPAVPERSNAARTAAAAAARAAAAFAAVADAAEDTDYAEDGSHSLFRDGTGFYELGRFQVSETATDDIATLKLKLMR